MTFRFDFWSASESWPTDPVGYVFLARAFDELGRAMFPDDWTGKEALAADSKALPFLDHLGLHRSDRIHALRLLRSHRPDLVEPVITERASLYGRLSDPVLSTEQWKVAAELSAKEVMQRGPVLQRQQAVVREIVRRCEAGELMSYGRPVKGGNLADLSRATWRTELLAARVTQCQINPSDPFGSGIGGVNYSYIFLGRLSLDKLIGSLSGPSIDPSAAWIPTAEQTLKDWCALPSVKIEAQQRAQMAVSRNPSNKDIYRAMARMWELVRDEPAKWQTIEQYCVNAN